MSRHFCHIGKEVVGHVYKQGYKPSSNIAEDLFKNILYDKHGVVALNKPYGISFSKDSDVENEVNINTISPFLTKKLHCSNLINAKIPEKYTSGVAIFGKFEDSVERVKKSLAISKAAGEGSDTFDAVVIGQPLVPSGEFIGGVTLEKDPNSKIRKTNFLTEWSHRASKRGDVYKVKFKHWCLASSENASLVRVQATINRWHAVRAYLATKLLCPVLGDDLFSSRIKTILGTPVLLDTFNPATAAPQKIPFELKKLLKLQSRNDIRVPIHLHKSGVILRNFLHKGNDLILRAPYPEMFTWTCNELKLDCQELGVDKKLRVLKL